MPLPTQLLHVSIAKELVAQIDATAEGMYVNRCEFIRRAIVEKLRHETSLPPKGGLDILMTDQQLEELNDFIRQERWRRQRRKRGYLQRPTDLLR